MPEASRATKPRRVLVAGYYADGAGYPNGSVTQSLLVERLGAEVVDLGMAMPAQHALWRLARGALTSRIALAFRLFTRNVASLLRVLRKADRREDVVYVRYPCVPFMLLASFLPRAWRPRCIVDAFISIADSMFTDRARDGASPLARLVRAVEGRALRAADTVLVDTAANAVFMAESLGIDRARIVSLPLGVEEHEWRRGGEPHRASDGVFVVCFVGTFVPLHGFDVIVAAMDAFDAGDGIRFVFVGDGQDSDTLARFMQRRGDLDIVWHRDWLGPRELAAQVAAADVCLGVFGGSGKASRVLPYKLYLYFCLGKPVISQASLSTPDGAAAPVSGVAPTGAAVAAAIRSLRSDPVARAELGSLARRYFDAVLGNEALARGWRALLG